MTCFRHVRRAVGRRSFFSAENFENLQIAPQQLAVTATGLGAAALLAASLGGG